MACDSKFHFMVLRRVMSVKLNIAKNIAELEQNNDIELWKNVAGQQTYSGGATLFTGCFRRQRGKVDV